MRTTLVIDDAILRRAREAAAQAGLSLSALVERSLLEALSLRTSPEPTPYRMITFGAGGEAHNEPADFADAIEHDEADSLQAS